MSTELIINASLPETRIALTESGEIQELLIERAQGKGIVGNIYKGRVTRVLPGMQAAFVDIGLEKAAFLYVDDVYTHSEIWETEEETAVDGVVVEDGETVTPSRPPKIIPVAAAEPVLAEGLDASAPEVEAHKAEILEVDEDDVEDEDSDDEDSDDEVPGELDDESVDFEPDFETDEDDDDSEDDSEDDDLDSDEGDDDEEDEDADDKGPVGMGPGPDDGDDQGASGSASEQPAGTVAPAAESATESSSGGAEVSAASPEAISGASSEASTEAGSDADAGATDEAGRRRHRRGRRGGRNRKRGRDDKAVDASGAEKSDAEAGTEKSGADANVEYDEADGSALDSDRTALAADREGGGTDADESNRPAGVIAPNGPGVLHPADKKTSTRPEFREPRSRDRKIKAKPSSKPQRGHASIQDLLHEGQEVIVQVAKDPIATKGARLTCHISLPGRHLVCMPTIDHVGVSRRIENDSERRKLRDFVEKNRPKSLGFIVRTASGKSQAEKRIKQDIDYLTRLWGEIKEKAATVQAPAMIYEDLNSVLRAIRDWVSEDIDKIFVDSRYHYNEIQKFVSHFMPSLKQKVELYHGDVPIFDAYGISTELARALERKVWLKSGGSIVIDQSEALVAIDVNTGRYVGKKNLEDTILKTNLEAVQEIAYQLRLRNCGGIIILDLIDMEKEENRQRVYRALEDALKKDRARPSILKISELGLVEMTRKRTRDTMVRALCESCSHCEGNGYVKSKTTVAYEILREIERQGIDRDVNKILIQAHSDVIDVLAINERDTLDQLERRYRKQIYLQSVGDSHQEQYDVVGERREGAPAARELIGTERGRDRGRGRDRDRGKDRDKDREKGGEKTSGGGDRNRERGARTRGGRDASRTGGRDRPRSGERGVITPASAMSDAQPTGRIQALPSRQPGSETDEVLVPDVLLAGVPPLSQGDDDSFTEEDRLAFLRAQAAQDAALAKLGGAGGAASTGTRSSTYAKRSAGPGAAPGDAAGDRDASGRRRRRRGGRGRRDDRGPLSGEARGPVAVGAAPVITPSDGSSRPSVSAPQVSAMPQSTGSEGAGSSGSSGGGGESGGSTSSSS